MQLALRLGAFLVFLCISATLHATEEVKIASSGPGLSTLPLEIAARKRFFRDEGLDVLTITMKTNIAVNALLTRNVDYATPSTSAIKAATANVPVKTIAVLLGRPDYFLTVKKEIKSVEDPLWFGERLELPLRGLATRDETIHKNPKQVFAVIRAVFRAMGLASTNREENIQLLMNWLKLDREVAARSYELGKPS